MKKRLVIFGYGQRGAIYSAYAMQHPQEFELAAIIERNPACIGKAKQDCANVPVFSHYCDFLRQNIAADLLAICTQDRQHREHAVAMMEAGYDLLLEKPIGCSLQDCIDIYETSKRFNRKVIVCHVLRYTPFYATIKHIIESGELGQIVSVHASENVGYFHQAHSYVRGPWKRAKDSSPMIVAKCCHDMDIFRWLLGRKCVSVNSYGGLFHFRAENAPVGAALYCSECSISGCPYRAQELYTSATNPFCPGAFREAP